MNKSRTGIIYCCYGNPEYINDCLAPWLEAKKSYDILIASAHGQFKEYHDLGIKDSDMETVKKLIKYYQNKCLDFLYVHNPDAEEYLTDPQLRDKCLTWLLAQNIDIMYILDSDEFYTIEQINNIFKFINQDNNKDISWFSTPFKNYIFDAKQYIEFVPPRAFRTNIGLLKLNKFYYENDCYYLDSLGQNIDYKNMSSLTIPKSKVGGGIRHMTWLHSNGKNKVEYQEKHFGSGNCSYAWDYTNNKLVFNLDFYKKHNIPVPEIFKDEN